MRSIDSIDRAATDAASEPANAARAICLPTDLPDRLARGAARSGWPDPSTAERPSWPRPTGGGSSRTLKAIDIPITGTRGFAKAEVTAGGVSLDEVDSPHDAKQARPGPLLRRRNSRSRRPDRRLQLPSRLQHRLPRRPKRVSRYNRGIMPAVYDHLGVKFLYPDNWEIDASEASEEGSAITVYSPGGALWSLWVYPPDEDIEPRTHEVVEALRKEYPELDVEPVREPLAGHELVGYDLNFFCLDLTNTAWVRALHTPRANYVILCQAEDREFEVFEAVFRAITISLLRPERVHGVA